jgi:glycosyltransferase involved in cell wall biosynthesis
VAYLSLDGVMDPLGESQVLRYIERMSSFGFRFTLISLERTENLRSDRYRQFLKRMSDAEIDWHCTAYHGGLRSTPANLTWMVERVVHVANNDSVVWARGYLPAVAALVAERLVGTPYLFDTRGYWFDERRDAGGLFARELPFYGAKSLERLLFANASAVSGLTVHVLDDLRHGVMGKVPHVPMRCIPTCADYSLFENAEIADELQHITGKIVGYVGSFNASYDYGASFKLAKQVTTRSPDSCFVVLTQQEEQARSLAQAYEIEPRQLVIRSVNHDEIPFWLKRIDFGLLFCRATFAKRASMPTKLAEFFAAGVRPVVVPLNDEMESWIERAGSGLVLADVGENELSRAVDWILGQQSSEELQLARERTRDHFDIEAATRAYSELLTATAQRHA